MIDTDTARATLEADRQARQVSAAEKFTEFIKEWSAEYRTQLVARVEMVEIAPGVFAQHPYLEVIAE